MTGFLLTPGSHRISGLDDGALVAAITAVEVAWTVVRAELGALPASHAEVVTRVAQTFAPDPVTLQAAVEQTGTPVVPVVTAFRAAVAELDPAAAASLHRGLTSQDVLDSALMMLSTVAVEAVLTDLDRTIAALAGVADRHRDVVMTGRSLTQPAVPITVGLKIAHWLDVLIDAAEVVRTVRGHLPVQCGGAVGTLALASEEVDDPLAAADLLADRLGLARIDRPWQTRRTPLTRLGDALVGTTDALGFLASDVALLSRPEMGEVREGWVAGRGGSSTMPHKRNPVLAVAVRAAAMQAPALAAQLHLSAATWTDERPDGAWHAQWNPWRRLLQLTAVAASQAAELAEGLEVDVEVIVERAQAQRASLLAEGSASHLVDQLGCSGAIVDQVLARADRRGGAHG